jgi:hypothetical protein
MLNPCRGIREALFYKVDRMETKQVLAGFGIVVCDRGFIYVGMVEYTEQFAVITNAYNIRKWGTTKGLGELARDGNNPNTKLDACPTVRIPSRAIISIIESEAAKWKF